VDVVIVVFYVNIRNTTFITKVSLGYSKLSFAKLGLSRKCIICDRSVIDEKCLRILYRIRKLNDVKKCLVNYGFKVNI